VFGRALGRIGSFDAAIAMWRAERGYTKSIHCLPSASRSAQQRKVNFTWTMVDGVLYVKLARLAPIGKSRWARSQRLGQGASGRGPGYATPLPTLKSIYLQSCYTTMNRREEATTIPMQLVIYLTIAHLPRSQHVCSTLAPHSHPPPHHHSASLQADVDSR